jgi:D-alanine transaminase
MDDAQVTTMFERLLDGRKGDASIYLQVTRGVAARDHTFPDGIKPTVLAYAQDVVYPDATYRETGVKAVSYPDQRWERCDIKSVSLLANVLARQHAFENGASEAVLFRNGILTEGAASTLFVVTDGALLTPPGGHNILPGITRDLVLELVRANGLDCRETEITEQQVRDADELWMSSSTKEILPIVSLDGLSVGRGVPGDYYHRVIRLYDEFKQRFRNGEVS